MISKLSGILERFEKLSELVSDPEVIKDIEQWQKYVKERAEIEETANKYLEYKQVQSDGQSAEEMLKTETDPEMKAMLEEEYYACKKKLVEITDELKILLLPKDPDDNKNVIVEIRGGAGGEEAALFAYELYRMYVKFAESNRWKTEEIDSNETELGGIKEVVFSINGKGAYSKLKYESGVHRVQRVPDTESQGRIHTSTVTVAVLPEAEDVEINIEEKDLKIDTFRSSGAGGQHVNKTESCIRMTHIPTGIVVTCQDERSQIKNRERAMSILKSKLYTFFKEQADSEYSANRKSQVGTGDRSERIRTYNYPQGRITDHRINYSIFNIEPFLDGEMTELITALQTADQQAKLEALSNN